MYFADRLTLDAPRRTKDGYMAVRARAARTGVYDYAGSEVDPENKHGLRDQPMVKVLRDEGTVFDEASARSFIGKPITDNHPHEAVTASNWRDHARGTIMGAMRDGDYLAFDLLLTDADAISKVQDGKRELSNGYAADLQFGDFTAPDGTKCQARQASISGNHVALVDRGRAGPECGIKDEKFALCDANPAAIAAILSEKTTMKIKIGDAEVDATNGEAVRIAVDAINVKMADKDAQIGKLTADLATANTALQTKDGEIAALNTKLSDATDPAKIAVRDAARAKVIEGAKAIHPTIATDGKSDAEIRKEAVIARLGDAAKDMADAAIDGAFTALTKDVAPADPVRQAIKDNGLRIVSDNADVRNLARAAQY